MAMKYPLISQPTTFNYKTRRPSGPIDRPYAQYGYCYISSYVNGLIHAIDGQLLTRDATIQSCYVWEA